MEIARTILRDRVESRLTRFASNAVWTLRGIPVPDEGGTLAPNQSHEVKGLQFRAISFTGRGEFIYSNEVPVFGGPSKSKRKKFSEVESHETYRSCTLRGGPCLLTCLGHPTDDQRVTVRATDERGRNYYAKRKNCTLLGRLEL